MEIIQAQIRDQILRACRGLLSEINRDPASPTCGCFDRRYWAWKTIDFPEATFQRNLSALAWIRQQPESEPQREFYSDVIRKGLLYTTHIQHKNGSFDQAYPYEASYGATAFLLPDLLDAYLPIRGDCSGSDQSLIDAMLSKAADFLFRHAELHGTISNHLAGAALGLLKAAQFFENDIYAQKAQEIVEGIVSMQSSEGWYVEYGGADPGYQTLCMHYFAQIYQIKPDKSLRDSLESSLNFLQYFIHPDGTFGGEYGSRRTEVYYPGGIALLSGEFPTAAAMNKRMLSAIAKGQSVALDDIDMGNTAPLLNSTIKALGYLEADQTAGIDKLSEQPNQALASTSSVNGPLNKTVDFDKLSQRSTTLRQGSGNALRQGSGNALRQSSGSAPQDIPLLPIEQDSLFKNFPQAGLCIHATSKYYCVTGLSNGGVVKLFDKKKSSLVLDDNGLLGETSSGLISTQFSDPNLNYRVDEKEIDLESGFSRVKSSLPSPSNFLLLRLMNLTVMRLGFLNELIKKLLVRMLISGTRKVPLKRKRIIQFTSSSVEIQDEVTRSGALTLKWLRYGGKFSSIHMASARYFTPAQTNTPKADVLDVEQLNKTGMISSSFKIKF